MEKTKIAIVAGAAAAAALTLLPVAASAAGTFDTRDVARADGARLIQAGWYHHRWHRYWGYSYRRPYWWRHHHHYYHRRWY